MAKYIMTVTAFIDTLLDIANNTKTIYILGCFGAPMNVKNKTRYTNNNTFNKSRANLINACSSDTFGFDCVGLIKGVLWGWNKDVTKTYGGATYKDNGVPDVGANSMMNTYCEEVSSNFKNIVPGEAVWIDGHIGVYIGDGKVVESTSKWTGKTLISSLGNLGYKGTYTRTWSRHGKLPWIDYSVQAEAPQIEENVYIVKPGDTLSKIAKAHNTTYLKLALLNKIVNPNKIYVGQKIKLK